MGPASDTSATRAGVTGMVVVMFELRVALTRDERGETRALGNERHIVGTVSLASRSSRPLASL